MIIALFFQFGIFFTVKMKISNFLTSDFGKLLRPINSWIKIILAQNLLIYIYLHCVRRSSWIVITLATLISLHPVKNRTFKIHKCIHSAEVFERFVHFLKCRSLKRYSSFLLIKVVEQLGKYNDCFWLKFAASNCLYMAFTVGFSYRTTPDY